MDYEMILCGLNIIGQVIFYKLGAWGRFQKRFSGFCPLRGYPPSPTPLTENHFAKKPLADRGGTSPPPP